MEKALHLPQDYEGGEAATRGRLVHSWLEAAHTRSVKCTDLDLPEELQQEKSFGLSREDYSLALPYLRAHLPHCPLGPTVRVVQLDSPLYGYDRPADVVIAAKPDAVLLEEDVLIVRETKTTGSSLPLDANEAYDRWPIVSWLVSLLASGYTDKLGAAKAVVELEVLTSEGEAHTAGILTSPLSSVWRRVMCQCGQRVGTTTPSGLQRPALTASTVLSVDGVQMPNAPIPE